MDFKTLIEPYLFLCIGNKETSKIDFLKLVEQHYDIVNNARNKYCFNLFKTVDFKIIHNYRMGYKIEMI